MGPKTIDRILEKYDYENSSIIGVLQDLQDKENYLRGFPCPWRGYTG